MSRSGCCAGGVNGPVTRGARTLFPCMVHCWVGGCARTGYLRVCGCLASGPSRRARVRIACAGHNSLGA
eukprot:2508229-Prymnesium_polylepis.1